MIISFFGHSDFLGTKEYERRILNCLEELIGESRAEIMLGEYGGFDYFAYSCCVKFKSTHPSVSLIFVSPYISENYRKAAEASAKAFDSIVYPPIESKPKKLAIIYRNRYMVDKADIIIAYIKYERGGAWRAYNYAKEKRKQVINIYFESDY